MMGPHTCGQTPPQRDSLPLSCQWVPHSIDRCCGDTLSRGGQAPPVPPPARPHSPGSAAAVAQAVAAAGNRNAAGRQGGVGALTAGTQDVNVRAMKKKIEQHARNPIPRGPQGRLRRPRVGEPHLDAPALTWHPACGPLRWYPYPPVGHADRHSRGAAVGVCATHGRTPPHRAVDPAVTRAGFVHVCLSARAHGPTALGGRTGVSAGGGGCRPVVRRRKAKRRHGGPPVVRPTLPRPGSLTRVVGGGAGGRRHAYQVDGGEGVRGGPAGGGAADPTRRRPSRPTP